MDVKSVFHKIDFIGRYQSLCEKFHDFDNRLGGNKIQLYDSIFDKLDYKIKYDKKETFYRFEEKIDNLLFGIQFVLKDGIIEVMLYGQVGNDYTVPAGRLDFLCEDLDSDFDRDSYNLPKYTSGEELEVILKEIFSLYEDYKKALEEHLAIL